jgi:hypothetical protein
LSFDRRSADVLGTVLSAVYWCCAAAAGAWPENLTQAERNVVRIRSFNRFRETFVVSIVNDYYRVLQLQDAVVNAPMIVKGGSGRRAAEMEAGGLASVLRGGSGRADALRPG